MRGTGSESAVSSTAERSAPQPAEGPLRDLAVAIAPFIIVLLVVALLGFDALVN